MAPKKRKFKVEYASELIHASQRDLDAALILQKNSGSYEVILFLLQQCVEKALKAILVKMNIEVPFNHNLDSLMIILPSDLKTPHTEIFEDLTPYATHLRYEQGKAILSKEDIEQYVNKVNQIFKWASKEIKA
jgi:HEPN domain-containing protein